MTVPRDDLPLAGIRIIELGQVQVLPTAITPLAGMGADVIKIESANRPDQIRSGPQPENIQRERAYNYGGNFQMMNRNKRGLSLDITKPRGREVLLRLVAVSDVVAENFTTRVLRNLNIEYETLRAVNPRIVLLSSNGFGHSGPWQDYKAYGPNIEAVDGLMALTGYLDGVPQRAGSGGLGVTFPDVAGAYFGTYAILAALEQRERTGEGQWLDLSHFEAGVATIPEALLEYTMNGRQLPPNGNREKFRAPQGVYPCAGLDRWIAISVATDAQFAALCGVLGLDALTTDPDYASHPCRERNHDALDDRIAAATRDRDPIALERALQAAGVEANVVASPKDVIYDPQLAARGFFEMVPPPASAPDIGYRPYFRPGWLMERGSGYTRSRAPEFGEHTDEVLSEYLQMTAAEIAELEAEGIIAREPRPGLVSREPIDVVSGVASGRFIEADPDYRRRMEEHFGITVPGD